jgi:hypothetical protein
VSPKFDTGCSASCTVTTCSGTSPGFYWSNTTWEPATRYAVGVHFGDPPTSPRPPRPLECHAGAAVYGRCARRCANRARNRARPGLGGSSRTVADGPSRTIPAHSPSPFARSRPTAWAVSHGESAEAPHWSAVGEACRRAAGALGWADPRLRPSARPLHEAREDAAHVELATDEKELYNENSDPFELTSVAGVPGNAGLIAITAARLRELDPGWPVSTRSRPGKGTTAPSAGSFVEPQHDRKGRCRTSAPGCACEPVNPRCSSRPPHRATRNAACFRCRGVHAPMSPCAEEGESHAGMGTWAQQVSGPAASKPTRRPEVLHPRDRQQPSPTREVPGGGRSSFGGALGTRLTLRAIERVA